MTKGATNLVTAAPTLPAPKMPSAVPCLLGRIPARDVGDADRERAAGDADTEGGQQEGRVVVGEGEQPSRHRGRQHHGRIDDAAAILVGPDAEHRRISEPVRIGVPTSRPNWVSLRPRSVLDLHADDGKDRPDGKADGKGNGRSPQSPLLIDCAYFAPGAAWHRPQDRAFCLDDHATWQSSHL